MNLRQTGPSWLPAIAGVVAGIVALGAVLTSATSPQTTDVPVPVATSAAPSTQAPTTPAAPSPTETEEPDPAPTVSEEDELRADYEVWAMTATADANDMQTILEDFSSAATSQDIYETVRQAKKMVKQVDESKKNQPPSTGKYKTLHKEYNAMLRDLRKGSTLVIDGIGENDYAKVIQAKSKFNSANTHIQNVTDEINNLG